jgi:hypothetical protein
LVSEYICEINMLNGCRTTCLMIHLFFYRTGVAQQILLS